MSKIAVIGGGAAGMTAAVFALKSGANVTMYEKNQQTGRKICITGKGRCNLTNAIEPRDFLTHVVQGSKFLSSALYRFSPEETMLWFESLGVRLKTERGNRVFPLSERASDVRDALFSALKNETDFLLVHARVNRLEKEDGKISVFANGKKIVYDAVILATGGMSYPLTGSTGDGYEIARRIGHTITDPVPSLIRLVCAEHWCKDAQGLTLKNVRLSLYREGNKKALYTEQGELVFTDDGVSGPLVLSASAHIRGSKEQHTLKIDFKPALSVEELDGRILRDFSENANRCFKNSLNALLPATMRPIFVQLSGIDPEKRVHQITRDERNRLLELFKQFTLRVTDCGPIEEAIVTAGGVSIAEIDPHTMQSKICPGIFFAGELMDVDAYTGGYNLQIAFSTGRLAGESAANLLYS